ncbi:MAG: class I SAM-dependent DNA methyltransferase [Dissulfurispiraceae bacterium]
MTSFYNRQHRKTRKDSLAEKLFDLPRLYRLKIDFVTAFAKCLRPIVYRYPVNVADEFIQNTPPSSLVFEIGSGEGYVYSLFKSHGLSLGSFTGSDISEKMVDYCRSKYPECQWLHLTQLPYPLKNDSFDVVIICGVLHHLNDMDTLRELVMEAVRVGGMVLLYEPLQSSNLFLKAIKRVYWKITDGGKYYLTLEEYHRLFESAGAKVIWEKYTVPLHQVYFAKLSKAA